MGTYTRRVRGGRSAAIDRPRREQRLEKREGKLVIPLPFDEAVKAALDVQLPKKPPPAKRKPQKKRAKS